MSGVSNSSVERAHARVGTTLHGKWRLDRVLGVGGMAAVYAATHRNGARGAIKMLHLEVSLDADARKRFLREGYVANTVDHPGAVRVLDDDVAEDGSAYLVMELLDGQSLDTRAERAGGALPPLEVLGYAERLLDVLAAAHQKGIVHRDIKPDNVFVTQAGVLKLLDFGIARMRDGSGTGGSVKLTAEGSAFGTPAFMAPEQALGRIDEIDPRTDIFSVGATMFTLLTGRSVHVTRTINEQLVAQASRPPPPLASVAPHLPAAIAAIVDKALMFERERRWPDARSMRDAIHNVQAMLATPGAMLGAAPLAAPAPVMAPVSAAVASMGTVAPSVRAATRPSGKSSTVVLGGIAGALCVLGVLFAVRAVTGAGASPGAAAPSSSSAPGPAASATAAPTVAPAAAASSSAPAVPPPAASSAATPASTGPAPTASPAAVAKPPAAVRVPSPPVTAKPSGAKKPSDSSWLDRQH